MTVRHPVTLAEHQEASRTYQAYSDNGHTASMIAAERPFMKCSRHQLARLLSRSEVVAVDGGGRLFSAGESARYLYYLLSGRVQLEIDGEVVDELDRDFCGEECVACGEAYVADAVASEMVIALRLPKDAVLSLSEEAPTVGVRLLDSLLQHHTRSRFHGLTTQLHGFRRPMTRARNPWVQVLGWLLAIVLPVAGYIALPELGLAREATNYLSVFTGCIVMWAFRLLPEFVPALLVVVAAIVLQVVPAQTVLAGFSSGSFFMALSVFGIGALLVRSGLTYRLTLHLLARWPRHQRAYEFLIFLVGALLTPVMPTANGRVAMVTPLLQDMGETLGYQRGGRAMTRLAAASFAGLSIFSACILTSKSINFAVFDLFPDQVRARFGFATWLLASLAAMAVLAFGHWLCSSLLFRNDERPVVDPDRVRSQIAVLGRFTAGEWLATTAIVLFVVGVMSASFFKISPPWVGMSVLVALGVGGLFTKSEIRKDIDWAFLLMLAGMISIAKTFSALGVNEMIAAHLGWMEHLMAQSLLLFVLVFSCVVAVVRTILPTNAAIILLCIAFFPVADSLGFNPWALGFIVLLVSDSWVMAYQCTYYLAFRSTCLDEDQCPYDERALLRYNLAMNGVRVLALLASLPYWQALGVIE